MLVRAQSYHNKITFLCMWLPRVLVWALGEACLSHFLLLYCGGKGFLLGFPPLVGLLPLPGGVELGRTSSRAPLLPVFRQQKLDLVKQPFPSPMMGILVRACMNRLLKLEGCCLNHTLSFSFFFPCFPSLFCCFLFVCLFSFNS